ncbi:MAG: protease complex subunit PrcB family protein [Desulfobacterales bacterium]|nr:protease complex subunit PrcB family protein [Desulfobacterales bacterium]
MAPFTKCLGLLLVMALQLVTGCGALNGSAEEERRIPLEVLHKGSQCGAAGPASGAVWIDRPQDLPPALGRLKNAPWQADTEGALWVRMGAQPTGGFGLELAEPTASVHGKVATIRIDWRRPAPDRFVTQAFTSPCLVLKMPKAGIASIQVVDQEGRLRARVELP